jgi:hypothetical protein
LQDLGYIESYEYGESIPMNGIGEDGNVEWDWALIKLPRNLYLNNIVNLLHQSFWVEGALQNDELDNSTVLVCSGNSGTQQGTMDSNSTSMLLGDKVFELKGIILEHPLGRLNSLKYYYLMLILPL